jgi:hypothetical protein
MAGLLRQIHHEPYHEHAFQRASAHALRTSRIERATCAKKRNGAASRSRPRRQRGRKALRLVCGLRLAHDREQLGAVRAQSQLGRVGATLGNRPAIVGVDKNEKIGVCYVAVRRRLAYRLG